MLQPKELDKLFDILNTQSQSLQEIQGLFLNTYNDSLPVFQASYSLSHLLNHNLLTYQQRIIALFLLIQNYIAEGIKSHPFGATILNISQNTNQGFQRMMISDLLLEGKRQKYTHLKVDSLFDDQQLIIELTPQRPQIKKMREEFLQELPKISQTRARQILNIIPQPSQKNKKTQPPQQFSPNTVKQKGLHKGGFNVGRMRPIPKFVEINPFEMVWLSPGVVTDVHWDNSMDIDKKLAKCKGYIKKGLQHKLSKEQSTQVDRCLQNEAYAVLHLDLTPENLILLIRNNPYVAASYLVKLGNYSIVGDYLQALLESQISLNCIDVVVRLVRASKIPAQFIEAFVIKNLKQSQSISQNDTDWGKMGRIVSKFTEFLLRNQLIDLVQFTQDIKAFIRHFKDLQEAQILESLMKSASQEHQQE